MKMTKFIKDLESDKLTHRTAEALSFANEMNYNIFQNCDITKEIAFWRECLKMALKNNDTNYAMHCNEQITYLKQNEL